MRLDEYAANDALALADLVRRREVTPGELAALAVEAAIALDPTLRCMVETFDDKPATIAADAGGDGPFAGVPYVLKDLGGMEAGLRCELGSRLAAGLRVRADSYLGARFRRAGLLSVGRATTSEFGIAGTTETGACGKTATPWDPTRMAGGSSGGSAAAVAAGIVPIGHASDGGGSIRIPASACGLVGLKPTRGRVSFGPLGGDRLAGWAVVFAVTRSVRDTASLLDCAAGPEPGDPHIAPVPERPFADEVGADPGRLRVAFSHGSWSGRPDDPEIVAAVEATGRLLADLGHDVVEDRPRFDWEPFVDGMTDMWSAATAHSIDAVAAALERTPSRTNLDGITYTFLRHGRGVPLYRLLDCLEQFNGLARQVAPFFERYDLLVTPTLGALPAPVGRYDIDDDTTTAREFFDGWSDLEGFLPLFNCTGQPAISLPLSESASGLPIGIQLVGRFGDETTLLRVASQLETARPWRDRRPPVFAGR